MSQQTALKNTSAKFGKLGILSKGLKKRVVVMNNKTLKNNNKIKII